MSNKTTSRGRCDECGKHRSGITVVDGRDLCPACLPPLPPSANADRQPAPTHRDPLFRKTVSFICSACNGTGLSPWFENRDCDRCDGRGTITTSVALEKPDLDDYSGFAR